MEAPTIEDPWDWDTDQVVQALCDPTSAWMRLLETRSVNDPAFLEQAIRANEIEGDSLLTSVDQVSLRDDFGIKAQGPRGRLMLTINKLRGRSPKYLDYIQGIASNTPLPRYESILSHTSASRFSSPYVLSPDHFAVRYTSANNGFLQSPMLSPHGQQQGWQDMSRSDETSIRAQRPSGQPQNYRPVDSESLVPRTPTSDPQPGPREEKQQRPSDTSAILHEDLVAVSAERFDESEHLMTNNGKSTLEINSLPAASLNLARSGETYVVDESGRKRRKLVLAAVETSEAALPEQGTLSATNEGIALPSSDHLDALDVTNNCEGDHQHLEDVINPGTNQGTGKVDGVIESLANGISSASQALVAHDSGKVVIDVQGRKRIRPLLISHPESIHGLLSIRPMETVKQEAENVAAVPAFCEDGRAVSKALESSRVPRGRPAYQTYLGSRNIAVEDVFYSDTPLGQELRNEVHYSVSPDTHRQTEPETYAFVSDNIWGDGQRSYVHGLIKSFLCSRELKSFSRKGQSFIADVPYSSGIGKKHQPQSLTLFSKSSGNVIALRVDRSKWMKDDILPALKSHDSHGNDIAVDHFEVPEEGSLAFDVGSNEIHDWDFLEKWRYHEVVDKVLPLYGESGSEGEYDLDTWQEIEEAEGTIQRPLGPSKSRHLDSKEVLAVIDAAIEDMIAGWKETKLPHLEPRASRIWLKSRRDKTKWEQIKSAMDLVADRDKRLIKLKQAIREETWSSHQQVKKQCKSMQETLSEREELRWKISVLELRAVPQKPLLEAGKKSKPVKVPSTHDSLGDDEEDLVSTGSAPESSDDGGLDDLVVSDEDIEDLYPISSNLHMPRTVDEQQSELDGYNAVEEDNDDEKTITSLSRRRRRHQEAEADTVANNATVSMSPAPRLDDDSPDPPQDVVIIPSSSERTNVLSSDEVLSSNSSASRVMTPSLQDPSFSPMSRGRLPALDNDIIDLTQLSDPVLPETPKPKKELPLEIRTPPLLSEDDDPFRRNRKMESKFKLPPANDNIIDLGSDSAQSTSEEDDTTVSSKDLPDFRQVNKIARLPARFLIERQDRKRLLIWMIARTLASERESVIARTRAAAMDVNQSGVVSALEALKAHSLRIRGEDALSSEVLMRIATWYVIWSQCALPNPKHGIAIKHVKQTMQDMEGFEQFYEFLVECLRAYEIPSLSTTPEKAIFGIGDSRGLDSKRQKRVLNDTFERGHVLTPHKKRKYQVQESQEARDIRQNAQQRVRDRDARQRELKRLLEKKGLNDADPSSMVINTGKLDHQNLIFLNPKIGGRIQPHQREGVEFMWRELVTDDQSLQGCLLAHTMGLGKTMQVISFLVTVAEAARSSDENVRNQVPPGLRESRTLILCPPSLIDNWWEEFLMWTPDSMTENIGELRKVTSSLKLAERVFEISEWAKEGGVLLIGYSTFRDLIANKSRPGRKDKTVSQVDEEDDELQRSTPLDNDEHREVLQALLELPNIIVADEAHAIKNHASILTSTMNRFRSKSRIALTGSPLANKLEEYYSIVEWIAPGYLGDRVEFRAKYIEPIEEGLWADSGAWEKRKSLKMLHALKRDLEPKIHRADASILKERLRGKTEFVITVPLTKLQQEAYTIYVDFMLGESRHGEPKNATLWAWLSVLRLLCNHPKCFHDKLVENRAATQKDKSALKTKKRRQSGLGDISIASDEESVLLDETVEKLGIPKMMIDKELALLATVPGPLGASVLANKIQVLEQIMNYAEEAGDKTLIFSHSLLTLNYIEKLVRQSGRKYSRLDGETKISTRQQLTKDFNTGKLSICLISTRAGGQGLNMYGANRVVIVDDYFNPMYEEQAIGRAYRIGQQKHVYVYRLTVGGTFEVALQNQSLFKQQLAQRVVDKKNPMRHALKGVRQYLFYPKDVEQKDVSEFFGKDPYVLDRILASQEGNPVVRSITLSETFHQEENEELTAEERNEADQEWRNQQLRRSDPQAYLEMVTTRSRAFTDMAAVSTPFYHLQQLNPMGTHPTKPIMSGTEDARMALLANISRRLEDPQHQLPNNAPNNARVLASVTTMLEDPLQQTPNTARPASGQDPFQIDVNSLTLLPIIGSNTRTRRSSASASPERQDGTLAAGAAGMDDSVPVRDEELGVTNSATDTSSRRDPPPTSTVPHFTKDVGIARRPQDKQEGIQNQLAEGRPAPSSHVAAKILPKDLKRDFVIVGEQTNGVSPILRKGTGAGFLAIISRRMSSLAVQNLYNASTPEIGQDVGYAAAQDVESLLNKRAISNDDYRRQIGQLNGSLEENEIELAEMLRRVEARRVRGASTGKDGREGTAGVLDSRPPSSLPSAMQPNRQQQRPGNAVNFVTEAEVIESITTAGVPARDLIRKFRNRIENPEVFLRWLTKNGKINQKNEHFYPRGAFPPSLP